MAYNSESELIHGLFRDFSADYGEGDLTTGQVADAYEVLDRRYGGENLDIENVELKEFLDDGVEIHIDGFDDSPVYASDQHCVTWGNDTSGGPPEGRATDGDGNDIFGVR